MTATSPKQVPENLVLLKRRNRKYLSGEVKHPAMTNWWLLLGGLGFLMLIPSAIGIGIYTSERALEADGVEVEGSVTAKLPVEDDSGGSPSIAFEFVPTTGSYVGTPIAYEANVSESAFNGITVGQPVTVRYLPSNPEFNNRLVGDLAGSGSSDTFYYILLGLWVAMIFAFIYGAAEIWKNQRLKQKGKLVKGQLIFVKVNRNPSLSMMHMRYSFISPRTQKTIEQSTSTAYRNADASALKPQEQGAPVAVLYVDDKCFMLL